MQRLLVTSAILAPVVALFWLDDQWNFGRPGIWFVPVGIAVGGLACSEILDLLQRKQLSPSRWAALLGTQLVVLSPFVPLLWSNYPADCPIGSLGWTLIAAAVGIGLAFAAEMLRFSSQLSAITNVTATVFAQLYVGVLLSFLLQLRMLNPNRLGIIALVSVIFVVKWSDAGAYFSGRRFGKRKLAPRLSPGKTWEGVIGGIFAACLAAGIMLWILGPWLLRSNEPLASPWAGLAFAVSLTTIGIFGDLAESLLKRDAQAKDSSQWMPGLGGVLDVMDSLMFAGPVAFLWWAAGLLGT